MTVTPAASLTFSSWVAFFSNPRSISISRTSVVNSSWACRSVDGVLELAPDAPGHPDRGIAEADDRLIEARLFLTKSA
jgi:hypothetical protein